MTSHLLRFVYSLYNKKKILRIQFVTILQTAVIGFTERQCSKGGGIQSIS